MEGHRERMVGGGTPWVSRGCGWVKAAAAGRFRAFFLTEAKPGGLISTETLNGPPARTRMAADRRTRKAKSQEDDDDNNHDKRERVLRRQDKEQGTRNNGRESYVE